MNYKLGSLFDGSGGFPLAGVLCGIEPMWAAEVEPYPIAVTSSRFPKMKHLGDISKVNGAEIEPVDIITFGSPCQDLSVAGKRAGLKHEANGDEETTRSGLFMEAVRIIKEMRKATNGQYPRFALWENVPGAFSSNKGEDFRVVCEELIKIVEPSAFMPPVPKNGWPYADSYVGDGWSLAYRVFDAQYWGVPQRRRRIHLILDLRGERAGKVLFEREGVRGYFTPGGKAWERTPANAEGSAGANDREGERSAVGINGEIAGTLDASYFKGCGMRQGVEREVVAVPYTLKIRSGCEGGGKGALIQEDKSATLATNNDQYLFQPVAYSFDADKNGPQGDGVNEGVEFTCNTIDRHAVVYAVPFAANQRDEVRALGDKSGALQAQPGMKQQTFIAEVYAVDQDGGKSSANVSENKSPTLTCTHGGEPAVAYRQGGFADYVEGEVGTLRAAGGDFGGDSENLICERKPQYIVRRLTPTECARLQGFADSWGYIAPKEDFTDEEYRFWLDVRNTHAAINDKPVKEYTVKQMLTWYNKLYTDSAEYKMWGNGIALPPALYCMQGILDALNAYMNTGEDELTDLSDAPEEIKEEIMENAAKLENMTAEETPAENTETISEPTATAFNAIEQLRALAEERKVLAHINTKTPRFANDVLAIEYAVSVLEAVGL